MQSFKIIFGSGVPIHKVALERGIMASWKWKTESCQYVMHYITALIKHKMKPSLDLFFFLFSCFDICECVWGTNYLTLHYLAVKDTCRFINFIADRIYYLFLFHQTHILYLLLSQFRIVFNRIFVRMTLFRVEIEKRYTF